MGYGAGIRQPLGHDPHRLNGAVMEGLATAQKDWADREDVAMARQLLNCHFSADMHQTYAKYL